MTILQKVVKQRCESITLYREGSRLELVNQEEEVINIIHEFMPQKIKQEEITEAVGKVMSEINVTGLNDIGVVMGLLKERYKGRMDFAKAAEHVKNRLSS